MKTILTAFICFVFLMPNDMAAQDLQRGVSFELATRRSNTISNVEYDLTFALSRTEPIDAKVKVRFDLSDVSQPVVLDFNSPNAKSVRTRYGIENGHVVINKEWLKVGKNEFEIVFLAGDQSLNRNENFLYTLLVPDRASTVFPCFDQPDLKAKFKLTLKLPEGWIACANGEQETESENTVSFKQTKPISTYLFAFAAGEFETITREISGRRVTMFHRESDVEKVKRNVDRIFKMHEISLDWMEEYTQIGYPFGKFDFVIIPSFQYGGMEHNGSIFYNADQLFLDASATRQQKLRRASLIAHETAHMWFGNLVTMKWFDDVWLKEVFANFMAAKIVHPSFTDINHDLGFMVRHHPSAYSEDRTGGTYPIQQKLDNLRNAGTLYGRIIYEKAPIVMRQLESMIGQKELRSGLREYLREFSYGNAVWDDLIEILDRDTEIDLKDWSESWVKESGTPELASEIAKRDGKSTVTIRQLKKSPGDSYWTQSIDLKFLKNGRVIHETRATISGKETKVAIPDSAVEHDLYLVNGSELGYGYFQLEDSSRRWLLSNIHTIEDEVTRGAAWLTLYEALVRGVASNEFPPEEFLAAAIVGIENEQEPLNRQNILSQIQTVFWKFLTPEQRQTIAPRIEKALWRWVDRKDGDKDAKTACFKAIVSLATTDESVGRLYQIWESESDIGGIPHLDGDGIPLSETDFMSLAYELAVRMPEKSGEILSLQLERLKSEDRKKRFAFVLPSLSPEQTTRDEFFEALKDVKNRRPERWALDGLNYLHHPLRAVESEKYILPSLELLEEIQTTGDIFFPKRWLVATLSGHRSPSAARIVERFLVERPKYPPRLKRKILQAADLLLKAGQASNH